MLLIILNLFCERKILRFKIYFNHKVKSKYHLGGDVFMNLWHDTESIRPSILGKDKKMLLLQTGFIISSSNNSAIGIFCQIKLSSLSSCLVCFLGGTSIRCTLHSIYKPRVTFGAAGVIHYYATDYLIQLQALTNVC